MSSNLYASEAERQSRLPEQPVQWTERDKVRAKKHGWQVRRVIVDHIRGNPVYGHYAISGVGRPFRDEGHVLQFVTQLAEQGDDLAERALALRTWSIMVTRKTQGD